MEQVFFNVPLFKLEPIFKRWIKEAQAEMQPTKVDPTDQDRWFDVPGLCEYLPGKPVKATIYGYTSQGIIPSHKKGRELFFLKSEIDAWLKEGRRKTSREIEAEAEVHLHKLKGGTDAK